MKYFLLSVLFVLAGCQVAPSVPPSLLPARPVVAPQPAAVAPVAPGAPDLAAKVRHQTQYIEALLSQIEALKSGLPSKTMPSIPATGGPTIPLAVNPPPAVAPVGPRVAAEEPALVPNADGVIDLTATTTKAGEPVNPFAVRAAPEGAGREVLVHVSGLIAGPKPCAVVNERLVETGDSVEPFRVERIDPEAVLLRLGERRLRLPLSDKPVRVRLPN
jgi:hypothetical protein